MIACQSVCTSPWNCRDRRLVVIAPPGLPGALNRIRSRRLTVNSFQGPHRDRPDGTHVRPIRCAATSGIQCSSPFPRVGRKVFFQLPFFSVTIFRIRQLFPLRDDDGPEFGILPIEFNPTFHSRLRIGQNRVNRTFRFTDAAIDALVRMNDEHVLAFVKTVHRTDFDAIRMLAGYTVISNDICHGRSSVQNFWESAKPVLCEHSTYGADVGLSRQFVRRIRIAGACHARAGKTSRYSSRDSAGGPRRCPEARTSSTRTRRPTVTVTTAPGSIRYAGFRIFSPPTRTLPALTFAAD